ncbi:sulfite exporter TauE/SafE family protein [uncultured Albimonas sp.]|uniref:sulfite exporter TauE/SafE family protein n=1 Tax=uncultured Albimonas sp. TaxID=1331701 RepID=UPI0030EB33C2|tara:strand:+ start:505 stop:1281 length:777 start_codon:yes stop_codon:yes gene_type:complete
MILDPFDPVFLAAAAPAVLLAGISKGGFGGGAGFAATPIMALVLPPEVAVGVMLPLLCVMDLTGLRAYWGRWSWPDARALMAGALPGIALGAIFVTLIPTDGLRLMIGLIALGFVAFQLARARGWLAGGGGRPYSGPRAGFWGAVCGFTSFASHAGGPPAAVYLLGRGLEKTRYQATTVILFWWVNLVKLGPYWAVGLFEQGQPMAALVLAPLAVLGFLAGVWAHTHVPERWYFRVLYGLLVVTGGKLVVDGVSGLLS